MLTLSQQRSIEEFNRNAKWLKTIFIPFMQGVQYQIQPEWGYYEDAVNILDRSKDWYLQKRTGETALLIEGVDWKREGKFIKYKLESVERLKTEISK
jgi:hypothetical protein